jgi:FtsP/CotA-like multicopper oxidase with cupredoxin domain
MLTRRTMIKGALLGGTAAMYARSAATQEPETDFIPPPSPPVAPFQRRLPIPRVHLPLNRRGATAAERARAQSIYIQAIAENRFKHEVTSPDDDCDYYELVVKPGVASIVPGFQTPIWGYNGHYPGPTFLAKRERPVIVRVVNRVPEILSMHYHGGHTPPDSDGTPMLSFSSSDRLTANGLIGSRTYVYPNDNEFPSTSWYHDHGHDVTGPNVYRGLAGFYLLCANDHESDRQFRDCDTALPSGYGRYDIPMVFQDRRFNADGTLLYNTFEHDGFIGDHFLVNGAIQPYLPVARRKYRFRWLNGSNARQYQLFLSTGDSFVQIGTDGGLLPRPVERTSIRIAPAERYEVVIDFSRYPIGSTVYLVNCLPQFNGSKPEDDVVSLDQGTRIIEFRVHRDEEDPSSIPDDLSPLCAEYCNTFLNPNNPLNPGVPIPERRFDFGRTNGAWAINDRFFDINRVDAVEKLNTQSIWVLSNQSGGWEHPIHIHDMEFLILDRNGRPPHPGELGLKDVFIVGQHETVRVMACWTGAKNVGRYVFHCHNIEHEDMAMMGIFEVVP